MRVAMGDLTYIQPLGLPAFSSGFPGMPVYSGGLGRLALTCPSTEQLEGIVDPNDPCQAGSVPLNTPTLIDPTTNQPVSAAEQAAYTAAYQSGLLKVAYQQGQTAAQPATTGISSNMMIMVAVSTIALLFALRR